MSELSFPRNYPALAPYDETHPLPHPGYRAGQVWAAEDGSSVVITNTNQISPSFREDYPYLMADPSCPWLAPWSPAEVKSCAACSGKCCKDDFGYRIKHMAAEFYTHVCDFCSDGDALA